MSSPFLCLVLVNGRWRDRDHCDADSLTRSLRSGSLVMASSFGKEESGISSPSLAWPQNTQVVIAATAASNVVLMSRCCIRLVSSLSEMPGQRGRCGGLRWSIPLSVLARRIDLFQCRPLLTWKEQTSLYVVRWLLHVGL